MFVKVFNNQIITYPANPVGDHPEVSFPINWQGGQIVNDLYKKVVATPMPTVGLGWKHKELTPNLVNGEYVQVWDKELFAKEELKQAITSKRYDVEVNGIIVNGDPIHTDRESQTKIIAIAVDISQSDIATYSINWKLKNGNFKTFSGIAMANIITSVRNHVQACYNKEAEYLNMIDTMDTNELEDVDFSSGWPSNT